MTGTDLALGRSARQSSVCHWSAAASTESDAAFVVDGCIDRDDREYANHTAEELFPWWEVDLGKPYVIDHVVLYNRRSCSERLARFSLLGSPDGHTWFELHKHRGPHSIGHDDHGARISITSPNLVRYVRVRLDGFAPLHLRAVQIFGGEPDQDDFRRFEALNSQIASERDRTIDGRNGRLLPFGDLRIFVDDARYSPPIIRSLEDGGYEAPERRILYSALAPGDRVLEIGTAVGVLSMTAASIVGAENVVTHEANPQILADARRNFGANGFEAIRSFNVVLQCQRAMAHGPKTMPFAISRDFWASRLGATIDDPDIVEVVDIPTASLEAAIREHGANVLVCDIEGGEADLLLDADLTSISTIIIETHYWAVGRRRISDLVRKFILDGFDIDLDLSGNHVSCFRRNMI